MSTHLHRSASLLAAVLLALCLSSITVSVASSSSSWSGWRLTDVSRTIDLRTHIEEATVKIEANNQGSSSLSSFLLALPGTKASRVSFVEAKLKGKKTPLMYKPVTLTSKQLQKVRPIDDVPSIDGLLSNATFFEIELGRSYSSGESVHLNVAIASTRTLHPFPVSIQQADPHRVQWNGESSVWFSVYEVARQDTTMRLSTTRVESFSKKGAKRSGDIIKYGPFTDVTLPLSFQPISVHFVSNAPFVTFLSLSKDVEVSHWGNVAVQDNYILKNTAAELIGEFSRFDYERSRNGEQAPSSFRTIVAQLPKAATDVYYRDCIGNVSTSHVRRSRDHTRMEVSPRFPMFGGWTNDFHIGYNIPSQYNLAVDRNDPDRYVVEIPLASPFSVASIDELDVRIILPEGAWDIQWRAPYDFDSVHMSEFKTYLDTTGRPTLILHKSNCVKYHQQNVQVAYRYAKVSILREPLLITAAVMMCFLVVIAFNHADLRITDNERDIVAAAASSTTSIQTRRTGTELGDMIQRIIDNIMAEPNGLLAVASSVSSSSSIASNSLLTILTKELLVALQQVEKEDRDTFGPTIQTLQTAINQLSKAAKQAAGSGGSSLDSIVESIKKQVEKLAKL